MYEIIDDNGVIHSSIDEAEMRRAFDIMNDSDNNYSEEEVKEWEYDWEGDIKLIKVLAINR